MFFNDNIAEVITIVVKGSRKAHYYLEKCQGK